MFWICTYFIADQDPAEFLDAYRYRYADPDPGFYKNYGNILNCHSMHFYFKCNTRAFKESIHFFKMINVSFF